MVHFAGLIGSEPGEAGIVGFFWKLNYPLDLLNKLDIVMDSEGITCIVVSDLHHYLTS